jgi:hypothetical protein
MKIRVVAIRYRNNWLLPRKGTRHEASVVEIGYHHKWSFRDGFAACCGKLSPQKKSWHQVHDATRTNVATCDIFVAIEDFLATFWFSWQ